MIAPAPTIPPATPLAPVGITAASPTTLLTPARTALRVRTNQLNVLDGSRASFTGTLLGAGRTGLSRRVVALQALGRHGWSTVTRARTGARGRFTLTFVPRRIGSELIRMRFAGDPFDLGSHVRLGTLNVFRLAGASWYGGGGGLACGGTLTSSTLGVANKTLPCGTIVTLRYGGRTIRVPVIDRGPYVEGREFDLTEATKQALGFGDTGNVWSTR
jgi:rare lipoprotein A